MTKLTNEQIERILSKAPKKALTVDHDCKWYYLSESRSLDDLREILSLRQEVEDLKKDRDGWKHDRDVCNKAFEDCSKQCDELADENQELAAHVERLTHAGSEIRKPWDLSKILGAETRRLVEQWDSVVDQSPQTSLAEVRARAVEEAVNSVGAVVYSPPDDPHCCAVTHNDTLAAILSEANKIRNGGE